MIIIALNTANATMALLTLSFFRAAGFPLGGRSTEGGMGMAFAAVAFVFFTENAPRSQKIPLVFATVAGDPSSKGYWSYSLAKGCSPAFASGRSFRRHRLPLHRCP
jgi:hypothetical protein